MRVSSERGSALVEFTLVTALVMLLFVLLTQLAGAWHARNVLYDAATRGAHAATAWGADLEAGLDVARAVVSADLPGASAVEVTGRVTEIDGRVAIEIVTQATTPSLGGTLTLTQSASALQLLSPYRSQP